jgi:hypothetical protein
MREKFIFFEAKRLLSSKGVGPFGERLPLLKTVRESKKPDKIQNTSKIFEYLSDADESLFAHARQ